MVLESEILSPCVGSAAVGVRGFGVWAVVCVFVLLMVVCAAAGVAAGVLQMRQFSC
jgi:hypothetical protein